MTENRRPKTSGAAGPPVRTVAVDAGNDEYRNKSDAAILAYLQVGGVDPQMRLVALDRSSEEGFHLVIDLAAEPADLALGQLAVLQSVQPERSLRVESATG
jgi:hypothetical protein